MDLHAAVRPQPRVRRLADQRPAPGAIRVSVHRVPEPESAVDDERRGHPGSSIGPTGLDRAESTSPTVDRWFDTSAFVVPSEPTATFGNSGRNILRGPGQFTIDAALAKLTTRWRRRDRASHRGVQPAEQPGVRQPGEHYRLGQCGDDFEPDAVHADAPDPARFEGKILTSRPPRWRIHHTASSPSDDPSPSPVRAELDRILASELFTRSDRLSAFLRFIVERTLAGEGDSLKEHVIAIELYGKGVDFNTAADPIVRVDARRLRDRLARVLRRRGRQWHRHLGSERAATRRRSTSTPFTWMRPFRSRHASASSRLTRSCRHRRKRRAWNRWWIAAAALVATGRSLGRHASAHR